eukprot:878452-Rhodomonas_salina.8
MREHTIRYVGTGHRMGDRGYLILLVTVLYSSALSMCLVAPFVFSVPDSGQVGQHHSQAQYQKNTRCIAQYRVLHSGRVGR